MLLLNYRPVLRQPTGIGVYANAVLPALQSLPHRLIAGGEVGSARQRLSRLMWTQFSLPRIAKDTGAALVFTPAPEGYLGYQSVPQVVMVHDLRPITHPDHSLQSRYFRRWVPALLRSCRHIVTNSRFTAEEILRCTTVQADSISVIPLGCDLNRFHPGPSSPVAGLAQRPYLLHVGQAYPHKNLGRVLQAFSDIARHLDDVQLVLAGKSHPTETLKLQALVNHFDLQRRVAFLPYVAAADLPALYRGALALVYPSLWEGFGLPVLEAMACGVPVLTSYGSGTEEAAGDAALLVDPTDTAAIAAGLADLVTQPALRERLGLLGLQRAQLLPWSQTAERTSIMLQRLCFV